MLYNSTSDKLIGIESPLNLKKNLHRSTNKVMLETSILKEIVRQVGRKRKSVYEF